MISGVVTDETALFLNMVAMGIGLRSEWGCLPELLSEERWSMLYRLAAKQGVLAVIYDVVSKLPQEQQPPRNINIPWALGCEAIENRYNAQRALAKSLTELWNKAGIDRVAVIKGLSLSRYYPVPEHRECGDFDCYLFDDYVNGNKTARDNGAKVNEGWYKHSQISFHGLAVENHRFFVSVRGSKDKKSLERQLERYMRTDPTGETVPETNIMIPPVNFTALFLTYHSLAHFLAEGIRIRHVCDWACFVAKEQHNLNWEEFYEVCDRYNFRRFADALTYIAVRYLGLRVENPAVTSDEMYGDMILASVLNDDSLIYSAGNGKWWGRFKLLSNISQYRWKYREIYQKSYAAEMAKLVFGFIFDRRPKID